MNIKNSEKVVNGKIIASFVFGILTIIGLVFFEEGTLLSIVGIMLGVIGLKETKQYEHKGSKLALVSIGFNLIGFIGSVSLIVLS
ncbi:hypothetical protein BKP45_10185 [Anaerobacillus alkalidiazotrophicus]|uniref:DUF4190 domain-containing protein n=1 Tax=Anaerobacillus alkalidiazotrophicus TaxID=472963 RepID=A0A1S2M8Z8_9BACI|nr:DUF4190 domain-containing protein [Anaerobacillus alkalidiazotrophicus]OIJ20145.1 hypothetical protein BKP45_10185 [Anaerobacillus alkalidiazotrophicus]